MAFTDDEIIQIRLYLGYASTNAQYNVYLEGGITLAEANPALETRVKAQLVKIAALDDAVTDAYDSAGLKRVEEIEFYGDGQQFKFLNKEGCRLVNRLSLLLGVGINGEGYFSTSGYAGFNYVNGYIQLG